jgi:hypothetical protein
VECLNAARKSGSNILTHPELSARAKKKYHSVR